MYSENTLVRHAYANKLTVDELKQYIEAGKDVNYQDKKYGRTALMGTGRNRQTELIQMLLDANADVNVQSTNGWMALHHAALHNHPDASSDAIQMLLDANADVNMRDKRKKTALHWAAAQNDSAVIAQLIKAGADVNIQDDTGRTALSWPICSCYIPCSSLLLDAKADLWLKDTSGDTLMYVGLRKQYMHDDMMRLLLARGTCKHTGFTALMEAVRRCNVPVVKKLLALGANVYEKDKYGTTALHVAYSKGFAKILHILQQH